MARSVTAGVLLLFTVLLLLSLDRLGKNSRRYLSHHTSFPVSTVAEPYRIWRDKGVRGRILIHFDRKIRADSVTKELQGKVTEENYIYRAIADNVVRTVYHVIPDAEWGAVNKNLDEQGATHWQGGFRMLLEGTPIIVIRQADLPTLDEQVLVNLNTMSWTPELLGGAARSMKAKGIRSDLVTLYGSGSLKFEKELGFLHD